MSTVKSTLYRNTVLHSPLPIPHPNSTFQGGDSLTCISYHRVELDPRMIATQSLLILTSMLHIYRTLLLSLPYIVF